MSTDFQKTVCNCYGDTSYLGGYEVNAYCRVSCYPLFIILFIFLYYSYKNTSTDFQKATPSHYGDMSYLGGYEVNNYIRGEFLPTFYKFCFI